MTRGRAHRALLALPALLMLGGVPWANHAHVDVGGLPFLLVWMVGGVVLTSPVLALVYWLDRRADRADGAGRP